MKWLSLFFYLVYGWMVVFATNDDLVAKGCQKLSVNEQVAGATMWGPISVAWVLHYGFKKIEVKDCRG